MLIYTGFRLAHPNEFRAVYRVGREQLLIFASTIVGVLATDLLIGIGIGIAVKIFSHVYNGVPLTALFHTQLDIEPQEGNTCLIRAHHPAVFTNWIPFRKRIEDIGLVQRQNIILDLSDTRFIDHSVMDRLHELEREFEQEGLKLTMIGLESHRPLASHAQSARKRVTGWSRRLTIVADRSVVEQIEDLLAEMGIQEFTVSQCHQHVRDLADGREPLDRLEILVSKGMIDELTHRLRRAVVTSRVVSICMEAVDVVSLDSPFGVRSPHDEVPTSTAP
jgi:MFS superfamily sulfate permease-like transporter